MKILLVDNEILYLNLVAELLRMHSYEVLTASNGEKALEVMRTEPVDLVISDISMPKMNGFTLHNTMRADVSLQKIPFVWNSGYRELRDAVDIKDPEIDFTINKAMTIPDIFYIIDRVKARKGWNAEAVHTVYS